MYTDSNAKSLTTRQRCRALALAALMLPVAQGCYSYVPIDSQAPATPGRYVELQISDRGRVGLGDRLGPGVRRISGTVLPQPGNNLSLAVDYVANIDGAFDRWSGDTVLINREFIASMTERRVSTSKSALLAGSVAALVYATVATGLLGGGSDNDTEPAPPPNQSNRVPLRSHHARAIPLGMGRIYLP